MNVSLDSLAPDRFFQLTRRDSLAQVLRGLEAAQAHPELRPIKVNVVALKDFTEAEVVRFAEFARTEPYVIRFIEFMPLDADRSWSRDRVLPNEEVRRMIDAVYPLEAVGRERHGTSRRWRFADGKGEIGFISPVTEPFCGDCNRIRLTAEGGLRTCLFSMNETDLREPMRTGASDADLEAIIRDAVWRKELKHKVNDPGLRAARAVDVADRRMKEVAEAAGGWSSRGPRRSAPSACRWPRPRGGSPPRTGARPSTCRRSTARRWTATRCAPPTPRRAWRCGWRAAWPPARSPPRRWSPAPRRRSPRARRCPRARTRSCSPSWRACRNGGVAPERALEPGTHVRYRGEDVRAGDPLVRAGERLSLPRLSALASAGVGERGRVPPPVAAPDRHRAPSCCRWARRPSRAASTSPTG